LRVLFVVPRFHTNLAFAIRALLDDGVTPMLAVRAPGVPPGLGLPNPMVFADGARFADARRILAETRPDLVVIRKTPGLAPAIHRAALLSRLPMIAYDQRPWRAPRGPFSALSGLLRGRPSRRMTPVPGLPGDGPPDPRATYLPFPVPSAAVAPAARGGPLRLLVVGKLAEARKQPFLLIEAAKRLARRGELTVTVAGSSRLDIGDPDPGQLARLRAWAREGGSDGCRRLLEDVPFDAMPALYAAHDVCVLPSTREPLGTAPLEAMGQGAAAVISSGAGSAGYVAQGQAAGFACGAVFPDGDGAALEAAIAPLLADPEARLAARDAAWRWAREAFSPERFARDFRALAARAGALRPSPD
jgi:glycosyltransferase involved in cell wall biosynthesis